MTFTGALTTRQGGGEFGGQRNEGIRNLIHNTREIASGFLKLWTKRDSLETKPRIAEIFVLLEDSMTRENAAPTSVILSALHLVSQRLDSIPLSNALFLESLLIAIKKKTCSSQRVHGPKIPNNYADHPSVFHPVSLRSLQLHLFAGGRPLLISGLA